MQLREAMEQLDQIHEHLTRSEVYCGFQVPAVATVGAIAFVAAAAQPVFPDAASPNGFVTYWVAVAGVCCLLGTSSAVHRYVAREDEFARRRTRRVLAQFAPCIAAGVGVTLAAAKVSELIAFLPGLWAVIFGLGLVSARPYLPRGIGLVGLAYIGAGAFVLMQAPALGSPDGWAVGAEFGVGHFLTALVLWRNNERDPDDEC